MPRFHSLRRHALSAALLAAALFLTACKGDDKPPPPSIDPALTAGAVAHARGRVDIEGGVIRLAGSREGIIMRVEAEEGDRVRQDQILALIDDRRARLERDVTAAQLARARAAHAVAQLRVKAARREIERFTVLNGREAAARLDLDLAGDELETAEAAARELSEDLEVFARRLALNDYEVDQHTVRAPLDGWIVRRDAKPGDGVSTLNVTPLFLFAPEAPRIVRAELDERFVNDVRPGMSAEVVLDANPEKRFRGKVLRLGQVFGAAQPSGDPSEPTDARVVECVVALDDQSLRIGQRVLVRVLP
jgi:RND family efflux transporter MFP subunit